MSAWEKVELARKQGRPTAKRYIDALIEGFIELHGDRRFADDGAVVAGIGWFNDMPVTVIGLEKGRDTKEKVARNFGSASPEGYRKALRLMKQAEKFHRPVICFVDTAGAHCGIGAEERGQGSAIAENLMEMMTLRTPFISIIIGEGGSGGALALSVADEVWMLEHAIFSVISPEGCASILWRDVQRTKEAAEALKLTAQDLYAFGVIEWIIPEGEGAHVNSAKVFEAIREALKSKLAVLCKKEIGELLETRYKRFRKLGYKGE
ncbi:MAG: acetyl-CoA carboxylase carboxyltransferase subunit alpha [Bacillota bacterium]|nr:acetyl-CoA carboxylase carboxyltransferase subunit alpha [Bacillota bacterium]